MGLKEQWEDMRKSIQQLDESVAHKEEEERKLLHQHRDQALRCADGSSGSETLDD